MKSVSRDILVQQRVPKDIRKINTDEVYIMPINGKMTLNSVSDEKKLRGKKGYDIITVPDISRD